MCENQKSKKKSSLGQIILETKTKCHEHAGSNAQISATIHGTAGVVNVESLNNPEQNDLDRGEWVWSVTCY